MSKDKVINLAVGQIGYCEKDKAYYKANPKIVYEKTAGAGSDNITRYWEDLDKSMQGSAWCQAFINWLFINADKGLSALCLKSASYYTPTTARAFYDAGRWYTEPQKGDIVYYCSEDKKSSRWKGIYHVELVTAVDGDYICTIGGNTNNATTKVNGNGGSVANKRIMWKNNPNIAGFGRPKYDEAYRIGWHQDSKGWWYATSAESYAKSEWKLIDGYWYYFDAEGYAVKGLQKIKNEIFYFIETAGHPKECALCHTDDRGALVPWDTTK